MDAWARDVATRHRERVAIGTVFGADESAVVAAIDEYAAKHALANKCGSYAEAAQRLLGVEIQRQTVEIGKAITSLVTLQPEGLSDCNRNRRRIKVDLIRIERADVRRHTGPTYRSVPCLLLFAFRR